MSGESVGNNMVIFSWPPWANPSISWHAPTIWVGSSLEHGDMGRIGMYEQHWTTIYLKISVFYSCWWIVWKQPNTCGYRSAERTIYGRVVYIYRYIYICIHNRIQFGFLILTANGVGVPNYVKFLRGEHDDWWILEYPFFRQTHLWNACYTSKIWFRAPNAPINVNKKMLVDFNWSSSIYI